MEIHEFKIIDRKQDCSVFETYFVKKKKKSTGTNRRRLIVAKVRGDKTRRLSPFTEALIDKKKGETFHPRNQSCGIT